MIKQHIYVTAQTIIVAATGQEKKVAVAESCTGGLVGAALTTIPGASGAFHGGIIAYSNDVKHNVLGVPRNIIQKYGAVSAEVASAMVTGVLDHLGADLAVSITGIAGPQGGTTHKPVGTVWIAAGTIKAVKTHKKLFKNMKRDEVREAATLAALTELSHLLL